MKTQLKKLAALLVFAVTIFMAPAKLRAQANCKQTYLVENNTNCVAVVDITILCNNVPCFTYNKVSINPHTTYAAPWPASCMNCERCDVRVTLRSIGTTFYTGIFISGVTPPVVPYPSPGTSCTYNGDIMQWFPGVTMIDF